MSNKFIIEKNIISDDSSCYLIAEIGSNHNRSKKTVKKLIDASADAGFNAVNFKSMILKKHFQKMRVQKMLDSITFMD